MSVAHLIFMAQLYRGDFDDVSVWKPEESRLHTYLIARGYIQTTRQDGTPSKAGEYMTHTLTGQRYVELCLALPTV